MLIKNYCNNSLFLLFIPTRRHLNHQHLLVPDKVPEPSLSLVISLCSLGSRLPSSATGGGRLRPGEITPFRLTSALTILLPLADVRASPGILLAREKPPGNPEWASVSALRRFNYTTVTLEIRIFVPGFLIIIHANQKNVSLIVLQSVRILLSFDLG